MAVFPKNGTLKKFHTCRNFTFHISQFHNPFSTKITYSYNNFTFIKHEMFGLYIGSSPSKQK